MAVKFEAKAKVDRFSSSILVKTDLSNIQDQLTPKCTSQIHSELPLETVKACKTVLLRLILVKEVDLEEGRSMILKHLFIWKILVEMNNARNPMSIKHQTIRGAVLHYY